MDKKKGRFNSKNLLMINVTFMVISSLSLSLTTFFKVKSMENSEIRSTIKADFPINQPFVQGEKSIKWKKGTIQFGLTQTSGVPGTKYRLYYRTQDGSWIKVDDVISAENDKYSGSFSVHETNGKKRFGYRLVKETNLDKASKVNVDIFVK